jgi:4-alpha-glucanotransferase
MRPITLTLIIHDHQPVGNFDGVIARACGDAYEPFLSFLERHPRFRLALHTSGPLLEWLARERRDMLARMRALIARGQVEPWGGAFYEPVLSGIPEIDRVGQIRRMSDWIEDEFGSRPRGMWLAERVWEPAFAGTLAHAGIACTAVDDAHFLAAGLEPDQLWGPYLTEDQGRSIRVLPIQRELRYRMPFEAPERTIEWLANAADGGEHRLAVLGDDGEKFGVWPGTHALCWEQGWLDRLAEALEREPWIELATPAEAIERHAPLGLTYLPTASYHEMQEWSLPLEAQARYHVAERALIPVAGDLSRDLLRGGHWREFQTRYPESNRMQKRALRASRRLHALNETIPGWREAREHLWRAQCNDAYWHGVFGGLYLPMLREAIYRELIAVERWLAPDHVHVERGDFDLDGSEDALIETPAWAAWIGLRGGALWAFDDRRARRNWGDTLARRTEAYHAALAGAKVGGSEGETIHAAIRVKEPGLIELAKRADETPRDSFQERWRPSPSETDAAPRSYASERFRMLGAAPREVTLIVDESQAPALTKRYAADADGNLAVELRLDSNRARTGALDVVLNLGVHVPDAPDRFVLVNGAPVTPANFATRAAHDAVRSFALVDAYEAARLDIAIDREARLTREPIETVSLSEGGAERIFQGLEARFTFDVALAAGAPWIVRFTLRPGVEAA